MKQKRYTKRFEIEAEINKQKRRAKTKTLESAKEDSIVADHVNESRCTNQEGDRQFHIEQADFHRKKADKLRRSVEIINDVKIPALGRTLAAFQTNTLFPGDDQAVVLKR
jgi:hypothetical protein